jgi:hypothetical protein
MSIFYLKNIKKILLVGISLFMGGAGSLSILFHLGIAQNFNTIGKIEILLFGAIPFAILIFSTLTIFLNNFKIYRLIIPIIASVMILFIVSSIYIPPEPIKQHEIIITSLDLEERSKEKSFEISRIEIINKLSRPLPINAIKVQGNNYPGKINQYSPGTSLLINYQFSGYLVLFASPGYCPNIILITADGDQTQQDLCLIEEEKGLVLTTSDKGIILPKWIFLNRVIKVLDLFLSSYLIFILFYISGMFFQASIRKNFISINIKNEPKQLPRVFLKSAILFIAIILFILFTDYIWMPGYLPFLLIVFLVLLDGFFLTKNYSNNMYSGSLSMILIAGALINIYGAKNFEVYDTTPMPWPKQLEEYSFNAIVNRIYKSSTDLVMYAYDDVLVDREFLISQQTVNHLGFREEKFFNRVGVKGIKYLQTDPIISQSLFECIINLDHTIWTDSDGNEYIFLDQKYYSKGASVRLVQYQKSVLLVPDSIFNDSDLCK